MTELPTEAGPQHLYIHIPFCPSKCAYCAFVTHIGSLKLLPQYLQAIRAEMQRVARRHPGQPLASIYFGGGTPSLLTPSQLSDTLSAVEDIFGLDVGCEITIEAHPSTVDAQKLAGFRSAGATRISIGGETLQPDELKAIGRGHAPEDVLRIVHDAISEGFDTVALDLIYGLPGQTVDSWKHSLEIAVHSGARHLSLYPLSIEPRTVFARRERLGLLDLPQDDEVVAMYHAACVTLQAHEFSHYEVANWSQPGHACMHNLAYWHNREFFAVGVGAHGYLRPFRTENMRQTRKYIETVLGGRSPVASREVITREIELAETLMLQLRLLQEGANLDDIGAPFDLDLTARLGRDVDDLVARSLLIRRGHTLLLPEPAVPLANEIWDRFVGWSELPRSA